MPTIAHPRSSRWTAFRGQLDHARAAHAARRSLEREIADYSSESDLADLHAMLDRHPDEQTAQIRHILARRAAT
jgi:phage-related minor tail protein